MAQIKNKIEDILQTGYEILFELEKDGPDFSKIKDLYDDRSETINKLDDIPKKKINDLSKSDREPLKNLFTRLHLLEKKLNKNLSTLSEKKRENLKELGLHQKAKSLYTKTSDQNGKQTRKIVDLKSNS